MSSKIYLFYFINIIITLILSSFYILNIEPDINVFFAVLALISNIFLIYLVIFFILSIICFPIQDIKKRLFIIGFFLLLLHTLTVADILLYKIFKYHINGLVLNVIFTPGGIEALDLPLSNYIYFIFIIFIFVFLEILTGVRILKKSVRNNIKFKYVIDVMLLIILADKLLYAYCDIKEYDSVVKVKQLYPLYLPFTCKKFVKKTLHLKIKKKYHLVIGKKKNFIDYPLSPVNYNIRKNHPNILWILLDAWRKDAFNKILTPNIYNFSKYSLVFQNHRSGGIATRFGVFTLFYGIYGTYWHRFLEYKISPVFMNTLQKLNYDFKILTSSPLTFPEFDQTIFINLQDKLQKKRPGKTAAIRDENITEDFIQWLDNRTDKAKPFFSFIFMDAPHAKSFLPGFNKYKADKNSNFLIINNRNITNIKNAYLNAVMTDDFLVNKIITALKEKKYLKNTIILISADHGEEFYEHGYLGHTSAFTPEQNDVPLILYIPNKNHKIYSKLTCHYDIVPTIMNLIGVTTEEKFYSNGYNLLSNKRHEYIIASSWTNFAVTYNDYKFIFSTASYKAGLFEIRDNDFKLIKNKNIFKERIKDFVKISKDLSKF